MSALGGEERGASPRRFVALLVALLLLVLLHLVMVEMGMARLFRLVVAAVLAVAAWAVSGRRRGVLVGAVALGGPAVVAQVVAYAWPSAATTLGAAAFGLLLLLFVTVVVLAAVLERGPVDLDRIAGAVSAYLLLGLAWALLYAVIALVSPAAFETPPGPETAEALRAGGGSVFYYFSFVTLTTLGYGDVVPVSLPARTFTWFEAVAGQLYLVILIGRLVGLQVSRAGTTD